MDDSVSDGAGGSDRGSNRGLPKKMPGKKRTVGPLATPKARGPVTFDGVDNAASSASAEPARAPPAKAAPDTIKHSAEAAKGPKPPTERPPPHLLTTADIRAMRAPSDPVTSPTSADEVPSPDDDRAAAAAEVRAYQQGRESALSAIARGRDPVWDAYNSRSSKFSGKSGPGPAPRPAGKGMFSGSPAFGKSSAPPDLNTMLGQVAGYHGPGPVWDRRMVKESRTGDMIDCSGFKIFIGDLGPEVTPEIMAERIQGLLPGGTNSDIGFSHIIDYSIQVGRT